MVVPHLLEGQVHVQWRDIFHDAKSSDKALLSQEAILAMGCEELLIQILSVTFPNLYIIFHMDSLKCSSHI